MNVETFAEIHADQWRGCVKCKESHHETSYCKCGSCFFSGEIDNDEFLTLVKCGCGIVGIRLP